MPKPCPMQFRKQVQPDLKKTKEKTLIPPSLSLLLGKLTLQGFYDVVPNLDIFLLG